MDYYLIIRTVPRLTQAARLAGEDELGDKSNHAGDVIEIRDQEQWDTMPCSPTERTHFFVLKVKNIPPRMVGGLTQRSEEYPRIFSLGGVVRTMSGVSIGLGSSMPTIRAYTKRYFNVDVEQELDDIPVVGWHKLSAWVWNKKAKRLATTEELKIKVEKVEGLVTRIHRG